MNYTEIDLWLRETNDAYLDFEFLHDSRSQLNIQFSGGTVDDFPIIHLLPIPARVSFEETSVPVSWDVSLYFAKLVGRDRSSEERRTVVAEMWDSAMLFVQHLQNDPTRNEYVLSGVSIDPSFALNYSGHVTSGVLLTFTVETADTIDYCAEGIDSGDFTSDFSSDFD